MLARDVLSREARRMAARDPFDPDDERDGHPSAQRASQRPSEPGQIPGPGGGTGVIARVGDALLKVTGAYRINYETWGNLDPAHHTHIVPRFQSEPQNLRVLPPRQAYDWGGGRPFNAEVDTSLILEVREILKPFAVSAR